jgi:cytochrome c-type biogenesis protein CcmH/NrfG
LLGLLAALVLALSFVHVVARFRLYLVPVFLIYLGLFVRFAVTSLRARRITAVIALLALAGVGVGFQELATREGGAYAPGVTVPVPRQADLVVALTLALRDSEDELARRIAELAFVHDPGNAGYFAALGGHLERRGDAAGAALSYRRALEIQPDVAEIRAALERALGQRSLPGP